MSSGNNDGKKRSSGPVLSIAVVFFMHFIYLALALYAVKQNRVWPTASDLPTWGSIVVILAAVVTAAVCVYVGVAGMTVTRLLWAAAVVAAECVNIAWAVEGRMLEMAADRWEAVFLSLAECLIILPLLVFAVIPPARTTRR